MPAMTAKRPSITDVARHAGVSKATVSAVINDSGAVRDSTRDRVQAAIESMNYRRAPAIGAAAARKGRCIGLVIKELDNPYYAEVINGARAHATESGYTLLGTERLEQNRTGSNAFGRELAYDRAGWVSRSPPDRTFGMRAA